METFDIVGYCIDAEFQCVDCLAGVDTQNADPVFAGSEWDCYPTCCVCGEKCEDVSLTGDGILYEAQQKDTEIFFVSADDLFAFYKDKQSVWYDIHKEDIDTAETDEDIRGMAEEDSGWYYWPCSPGCLPDGDPVGPFKSELRAAEDILGF